jgi:hypothetical protein
MRNLLRQVACRRDRGTVCTQHYAGHPSFDHVPAQVTNVNSSERAAVPYPGPVIALPGDGASRPPLLSGNGGQLIPGDVTTAHPDRSQA